MPSVGSSPLTAGLHWALRFPCLEAEVGVPGWGGLSTYLVQVIEHLQGTPLLSIKPARAQGTVFRFCGA